MEKSNAALGNRYLGAILHLAPHKLAGKNVCPWASAECIRFCLNTSGMGAFSNVQAARIRKTKLYHENRAAFLVQLAADIRSLQFKAGRVKGRRAAVRLNGTSDIRWEVEFPGLFSRFPDVQFYDYTKAPLAKRAGALVIPNYHLTYSVSERWDSMAHAAEYLDNGFPVAVVFAGKVLPETFRIGAKTFPVVDGDAHDYRFLDGAVVVGLRAKGKARGKKTGGFLHVSEV